VRVLFVVLSLVFAFLIFFKKRKHFIIKVATPLVFWFLFFLFAPFFSSLAFLQPI